MTITKIGHCCLLIEHKGKRILTDPGAFTTDDHVLADIDIVLITHEHGDHLHLDSVKELVEENPDVTIITNSGVGQLLEEAGIHYTCLENDHSAHIKDILFAAFDGPHAEIYEQFGQVQNTGYFIDEQLFYPGDSYTNPLQSVPILALPVAGPWCRVKEVIEYVRDVQPHQCFPVHDGLLNDAGRDIVFRVVQANIDALAVPTTFHPVDPGATQDFSDLTG